jgi:hypothetical protein
LAYVHVHGRHGQSVDGVVWHAAQGRTALWCRHVEYPRHLFLLSYRHQCRVSNVVPRALAIRWLRTGRFILRPDDVIRHAGLAKLGPESMDRVPYEVEC